MLCIEYYHLSKTGYLSIETNHIGNHYFACKCRIKLLSEMNYSGDHREL